MCLRVLVRDTDIWEERDDWPFDCSIVRDTEPEEMVDHDKTRKSFTDWIMRQRESLPFSIAISFVCNYRNVRFPPSLSVRHTVPFSCLPVCRPRR